MQIKNMESTMPPIVPGSNITAAQATTLSNSVNFGNVALANVCNGVQGAAAIGLKTVLYTFQPLEIPYESAVMAVLGQMGYTVSLQQDIVTVSWP